MANFRTHALVGVVANASAATWFVAADLASLVEGLALAGVGAVASLLPDIDAEHSVPARWVRTLSSGVVAAAVGASLWENRDPITVCALAASSFVAAYATLRFVVHRWTTHRGIVHSVPFAAALGLGTVNLAYRVFQLPVLTCWLAGAFVSFGFVVHLLLDECSSVNLASARMRRSFGTALKLWSRGSWLATAAVYASLALAAYHCPSPRTAWAERTPLRALAAARCWFGG